MKSQDTAKDPIVSKVLVDICRQKSSRWNTSKKKDVEETNPGGPRSYGGDVSEVGVHPNKETC